MKQGYAQSMSRGASDPVVQVLQSRVILSIDPKQSSLKHALVLSNT